MKSAIQFDQAPVAVRDDIRQAHRDFLKRLSEPGTWWTGAERVAIAAEVRAARGCRLCAERKGALSPFAVDGEHDTAQPIGDAGSRADVLPADAVDAIHRIVSDASRLTRSWLDKILAVGLSDGQYVELVGVVVALTSVDYVCRGLGTALHALPDPVPGEPSRYRPRAAEIDQAWVPMLPPSAPAGDEADLWQGRGANVIRALSLVPEAVRDLTSLSAAHYVAMEDVPDPSVGRTLSRPQMELLAGRVSALNECFY